MSIVLSVVVGRIGFSARVFRSPTTPESKTLAKKHSQFEFIYARGRAMQFRKMARWEFNGSTHHPGRVICRCTKTCEAGSGSTHHPKRMCRGEESLSFLCTL